MATHGGSNHAEPNWQFDDRLDLVSDVQQGWKLLRDNKESVRGEQPYHITPGTQAIREWDNTSNWQRLRDRYQYSRLEIINEPLFSEPFMIVTEKYPFSVTAANLPVFVAPAGTVAYYRSQGFDVFDDIIDHSYDLQENPLLRMESVIAQIQRLTQDTDQLDRAWKSCLERFQKNYQHLQTSQERYRQKILESARHYNQQLNIPATPRVYRDWETDRKSTRLNSSHLKLSRMPSSA